ncbi:MAG: class I SAM-dependent methyltransferase [Desulfomonilaceae bacterium]
MAGPPLGTPRSTNLEVAVPPVVGPNISGPCRHRFRPRATSRDLFVFLYHRVPQVRGCGRFVRAVSSWFMRASCNDYCCGHRDSSGWKEHERSGIFGKGKTITRTVVTQRRLYPFDVEADRYDLWFESPEGKAIFDIERNCLRALIQTFTGLWLEVGVGSGRFAASLGISEGVDPSQRMLAIAARRGIHAVRGIGEELPYQDAAFDGVLMVTTLCFLIDPKKTLSECRRVLHSRGTLVVGIVPAESAWGLLYRAKGREGHPLYSKANFYKCAQIVRFCAEVGFVFSSGISCLLTPPGEAPAPSLEKDIHESAGFVTMSFYKA